MFQNIKKTKCYLLYFGAVLWLCCAISLLPVAKVQGEEHPLSSDTSPIGITQNSEEAQQEPPSLQKKSKKQPADPTDTSSTAKPLDKPAYSPPEVTEDKQQDKNNTPLIIGAGAAAAAVLALALSGGGGGGGGGEGAVEPVGVDIAGTWTGYLDLVDGEREHVTAVVQQNGAQVEITTSSTQSYGKVFKGEIDSNGDMLVYDQANGEDWTTLKGPAYPTQIDLYDYVNNYSGLDQLFLQR